MTTRLRRLLLLAGLLLVAAAVAGVAQPRLFGPGGGGSAAAASSHSLAHGAAAPSDRTISVTGNGTATTVPDRASFSFGVTTTGTTAKEALASNSAAAAAVIAALKTAGVAAADLQTAGVSLSPQTSPDGSKIVGYQASNTVEATAALAKAGAIVDAAVDAGANSVSGPGLDTSDQAALYREALKQAVADAKAKAQALAAAAGVQLGAVQSIQEGGSGPIPLPFAAKGAPAEATPIEPGTQQITATATVTYAVS